MRVVQGVIALLFDESSSLSAPAAFGTYRVLHQVGSGVLGPVFRTSDPRRPELVAVKAFRLDLRPDEVVRLADALRRLAATPPVHPALATIVDAGLDGTTPFLATEYLIGDTLDVILRRRAPLPVAEALAMLGPVAAALDAAWSTGVGHGALHPRDVFIGTSGIKVTGVGVAQALEHARLSAPARRPYTAPERASRIWDQRADVYSLAVVAHELLTGRRPAGPTEQDGVFASDVPPEQRVAIRRVLGRALAEQPEERFSSSVVFLEALEAVAAVGTATRQPLPEVETGLGGVALDLAALNEALPGTPDRVLFADDLLAESETSADFADTLAPPETAGLLYGDAAADLTYRPATDPDVLREELPPTEVAVPTWMGMAEDQPPSRRARWGVVAAACLVVGGGVGYFAATYDPFGDALSTVAERQPIDRAAVPAAGPEPGPAVPAAEPPVESRPLPASAPPPEPVSRPRAEPKVTPPPPAPAGALEVRSEPSGAMVTLDGRLVGETPLVLRDLTAGPYQLRVARPGYAPHSERVTISPGGADRIVRVALEAGVTSPGMAAFGAIDVDSEPRGARVSVDGRFVGRTPLRVAEVRPGPHTVSIELANQSSLTRQANVEPGKTAKVIVNLR